MLSPCSVARSRPRNTPAGTDRTSAAVRPPPALIEPPRPWNTSNSTPAASQASAIAACACRNSQREAASPIDLLLSEYPIITTWRLPRVARCARYTGSASSLATIAPAFSSAAADSNRGATSSGTTPSGPSASPAHCASSRTVSTSSTSVAMLTTYEPMAAVAVAVGAEFHGLEDPQRALGRRIEAGGRRLVALERGPEPQATLLGRPCRTSRPRRAPGRRSPGEPRRSAARPASRGGSRTCALFAAGAARGTGRRTRRGSRPGCARSTRGRRSAARRVRSGRNGRRRSRAVARQPGPGRPGTACGRDWPGSPRARSAPGSCTARCGRRSRAAPRSGCCSGSAARPASAPRGNSG